MNVQLTDDIPSACLVLIGFNRPDTIKHMLANLSKCDGLHRNGREAWLFLDGARGSKDESGVSAVHAIADEFRGKCFPTLHIVARERNYGCRGNIVDAITQTLERYGRAIIIEDDILVSRTFLTYMDAALEFYKDDPRIWCINANVSTWMRLPKSYHHDVYLTPRNMCWGWGTWRNRWEMVDFDLEDWQSYKSNPANLKKLDDVDIALKWMLDSQYRGTLKTWDVQCFYHLVKNGLFAVEPRYPLSKNIGSGTQCEHCAGECPIITKQPCYNYVPKLEHVDVDDEVLKCIGRTGMDLRLMSRIKRRLLNFLWRYRSFPEEPIDL